MDDGGLIRPLRDGITSLEAIIRQSIRDETGAAAMKRMINGFEVDWASERVFAEQQTEPNYG